MSKEASVAGANEPEGRQREGYRYQDHSLSLGSQGKDLAFQAPSEGNHCEIIKGVTRFTHSPECRIDCERAREETRGKSEDNNPGMKSRRFRLGWWQPAR